MLIICPLWALVMGTRLWERRPSHEDFARVRIGQGVRRAALEFLPPQTKPVEDLEPLTAISLRRFTKAHQTVPRLPDALAKAVDARETVHASAEGSPERASAAEAYKRAVKVAEARMKQAADLSKGSDLWHFRMFSQRPGETMHEVSADLLTTNPSAEANPLTAVIVHGHRLPRVDIGFGEGSRQITKDEGRKLNYVAELATRTGLWNHRNGLPLPRITVTGRGNARRPTLGGAFPEAARQRAEAVHGSLRDRLDRYLINYQHGAAQPKLTAWAAVANTRAGFPPPRVTVVGHATGMRGGLPHFGEALRRGQARADGVAEVFRSALAVHLERLQAGGETVTLLADIEVTTRSEGNAPPVGTAQGPAPAAARRHAFVVVELPRPVG